MVRGYVALIEIIRGFMLLFMNEKIQYRGFLVSTSIAAGIGVLVLLLSLFLCAFIPLIVAASPTLLNTLIFVSVIVSGFCAGYVNARMIREKGMVMGLAAGLFLTVLLAFCSVFFPMDSFTLMTVLKLLALLLFAGLGGICGVNKRAKRIKFK